MAAGCISARRRRGNAVEDAGAGCCDLRAGGHVALLEGIGGRYFEDCNEAGPNVPGTRRGYAPWARDPAAAERLWDVSLRTLAG